LENGLSTSLRVTPEDLTSRLSAFLQRAHNAHSARIGDLRLLTGGAFGAKASLR